MTTVPYQKEHLKSLTGLRFFAALSVFLAHITVHWPEFDFGDVPYGAAGVSFFYVLSGFILTYVYGSRIEDNAQGIASFSFKQFYLRRFARIWPLHFVTLLLSLFIVMGVQVFFRQPNPIGKLLLNGLLLQSWVPNYQWIYSLNGPSWSLAVEAFFYVVFPFLLLGGAKRFVWKFVVILLGTVIALWAANQFVPVSDSWIKLNSIVHTNPLMRLFEFTTGVGCGFLFLQRSPKQPGTRVGADSMFELLAIAVLIGFFVAASWLGMYSVESKKNWPLAFLYWFRFCGAAPVFALIVYTFAGTNGIFSTVLSSRFVVYLGEISYSFYMVHMGVMLVLRRIEWIDAPWIGIGGVICSLLFSLFFASALYQLIELPFRRSIVDWASGSGIGSVFKTWGGSLSAWVRTVWFVPLLLLAIGSGWFVIENKFDIRDQVRIQEIVAATDLDIQNVEFEEDATLLGAVTQSLPDGGLILEIVWELKEGRRSERFIKLLDADQKVIGRGNANRALFDKALGNDTVIDRVRIPADKMKGVHMIAVGFFDQQRKAALVDRGPRSARDRQLHVWSSDHQR